MGPRLPGACLLCARSVLCCAECVLGVCSVCAVLCSRCGVCTQCGVLYRICAACYAVCVHSTYTLPCQIGPGGGYYATIVYLGDDQTRALFTAVSYPYP